MNQINQVGTLHVNGVKGYTTIEVSSKMGGVTRQAVHDYASRHNWRSLGQVGRVVVWSAHDVDKSLASRTPRNIVAPMSPAPVFP